MSNFNRGQPFQNTPFQQQSPIQQQQNLQNNPQPFKGPQIQQFGQQNINGQFPQQPINTAQQMGNNFQLKMQSSYPQPNQYNNNNPQFAFNATQQTKQGQNFQKQNSFNDNTQLSNSPGRNNAQFTKQFDKSTGVSKFNSNDNKFQQNFAQNPIVEQSPKNNKQSDDTQFEDFIRRLKDVQDGVVNREKAFMKLQKEALSLVNTDFTTR